MPIEIKDLDGGLGVLIFGTGVVSNDDYVDKHKKHLLQNKDKFNKYRYSLSDLTAVTEADISSESISLIAGLCRSAAKFNPYPVIAIIANQNLIYGLARMTEMLIDATGWEHEVFRNREDAESWIRERLKKKYGIGDLTMT